MLSVSMVPMTKAISSRSWMMRKYHVQFCRRARVVTLPLSSTGQRPQAPRGTVDTNGLILHVLVHEANIQDYRGGKHLLAPLKGVFPRLKLIWAGSSYKKAGFGEWSNAELGCDGEV